jgi:hypothetical protein
LSPNTAARCPTPPFWRAAWAFQRWSARVTPAPYLGHDEPVIVDGRQGVILVGLDERILRYYRHKQQEERRQQRELNKLKGKPAITRDGVTIGLYANIELPEDAVAVREVAADGIGLYRTEFLFMNRADTPDEEEHLASYLHVIKTLGRQPHHHPHRRPRRRQAGGRRARRCRSAPIRRWVCGRFGCV